MKNILVFILLLIATVSFGQGTPTGTPTQTSHQLGALTVDSNLKLPFRTLKPYKYVTRGADTVGTIFVNTTDSMLWYMKKGQSQAWRVLTSADTGAHVSISNIATAALTWNADYIQNVNHKRLDFETVHRQVMKDDSSHIYFSQDSSLSSNSRNMLFLFKNSDTDAAALGTIADLGFTTYNILGQYFITGMVNKYGDKFYFGRLPGSHIAELDLGGEKVLEFDSTNATTSIHVPFNDPISGNSGYSVSMSDHNYVCSDGFGSTVFIATDNGVEVLFGDGSVNQAAVQLQSITSSFSMFNHKVDLTKNNEVNFQLTTDTLTNEAKAALYITHETDGVHGMNGVVVWNADTLGTQFALSVGYRMTTLTNKDTLKTDMTIINCGRVSGITDTLYVPASSVLYNTDLKTTILFKVHNTGGSSVRLISAHGETINGAASQLISAGNKSDVYSDGTNLWTY